MQAARRTPAHIARRPKNLVATLFIAACIAAASAERAVSQSPAQNCQQLSATAHYKPVQSIDFSSKHNVMIRSGDGTLTPMDVPYYRSTLIAPGTWQIESDGDYSYLVEGDDEALAIDTGYGAGNIRVYLQTLTKKPVRFVANTHDHFDHTANDAYFDCAYMSAETAKKATVPFSSFYGISFPRDYPKVLVGDGYKIQLGNREIEVFVVPNHTAGGTAYLDRKSRILFSGDEIFRGSVTISATGSVAQFEQNMGKLEAHRRDFDKLATGGFGVIDGNWVDRYLANARYILAGHEGGPATQGHRPPPPADPSGQVVYNRRFPRPGDSADAGKPQPAPSIADLRTMTFDDSGITYDIHRIQK